MHVCFFAVHNGRYSHWRLRGGVKGQRVNKKRFDVMPCSLEIVSIKRDNISDALADRGGWVQLSAGGFPGFLAKLQHACGGFARFENQGGGSGITVRDNGGGCICSHFVNS